MPWVRWWRGWWRGCDRCLVGLVILSFDSHRGCDWRLDWLVGLLWVCWFLVGMGFILGWMGCMSDVSALMECSNGGETSSSPFYFFFESTLTWKCQMSVFSLKSFENFQILINYVSFFVFHFKKRKKLSGKLPKEIKKNCQKLKNCQN